MDTYNVCTVPAMYGNDSISRKTIAESFISSTRLGLAAPGGTDGVWRAMHRTIPKLLGGNTLAFWSSTTWR